MSKPIKSVKLTLPVITKTVESVKFIPGAGGGSQPWLAPYVCSGKLRSGSYPGNIYHNNGRVYLTTLKPRQDVNITTDVGASLVPLRKMFPELTDQQIGERIEIDTMGDTHFRYSLNGDYILFHNVSELGAAFYIELNSSDSVRGGIERPYISIGKDGLLHTFSSTTKPHFKHNPIGLKEILKYVTVGERMFECRFPKRYEVQFELRKRGTNKHNPRWIDYYRTHGLLQFKRKMYPHYNKNVYMLMRVTRKNKRGKIYSQSDWTYFRTVGYRDKSHIVLCDEAGAMHSCTHTLK